MRNYQAIVIGGGSAGLAAAIAMKEKGIDDLLVIEKDREPGGILQQCIHNGFGLQTFKEQLSGPAYAERFIEKAEQLGIRILLNTMVTHLYPDRTMEYMNSSEGTVRVSADVIILAVGCYERNRGAVQIPGTRPAGVYTAGQAQRYLNIEGYLVGRKVFILGSGDIGLIMARRMTLEGAKVYGVAELMPYSNGLPRNIQQCLKDFDIPLYLSHTVTNIYGKDRLERIEVSRVDDARRPVKGSEMYFDVDTLLLSVGLIPENHLAEEAGVILDPRTRGPLVDADYMTNVEGIFSCGNGLHVHDLVDFVSLQAQRAGEGAVRYLLNGKKKTAPAAVTPGSGISYVVPSSVYPEETEETKEFFFRVKGLADRAEIRAVSGGRVIKSLKRRKLSPSEMERITLTKEQLSSAEGELVIEMEEL